LIKQFTNYLYTKETVMALLKIGKHLANDPQTIMSIYKAFESVEALGEDEFHRFLVYRVKGQGVPSEDKSITAKFVADLSGNTRITEWSLANKLDV